MLLGGQWHLVPAWWSVALQGGLVGWSALCLVPHRHYHAHLSVSGGNRKLLYGLHRASALSTVSTNAADTGSSPGLHQDFMTSFALPIVSQVLPLIKGVCLQLVCSSVHVTCAAEFIGVLSTLWRTVSLGFLWLGTIEHTALSSGLSAEITLPSPLLQFSPEKFCGFWVVSL